MNRQVILYLLASILTLGAVAFAWLWYSESQTDTNPTATETPVQDTTTQPEGASKESNLPSEDQFNTSYISEQGVTIEVTEPMSNQVVTSPMGVTGEVPGNWSFEASFPIKLYDANRTLVAEAAAQIVGDWMTEELVPFSATIPFDQPSTETGYLVLENANPSGIDEYKDEVEIPIRF